MIRLIYFDVFDDFILICYCWWIFVMLLECIIVIMICGLVGGGDLFIFIDFYGCLCVLSCCDCGVVDGFGGGDCGVSEFGECCGVG